MAPSPSPYHHGDLANELRLRACDHINALGVETLSIRALARDAGVAHRAAYQHFADKDALIAAVLSDAYGRLENRLRLATRDAASPDRALIVIAPALARFAFDEPNIFLTMTGPRLNSDNRFPELERALARCWRYITEAIENGQAEGLFTYEDSKLAAALYWGGLQGVITQALLGRLKLKVSERPRFFTQIGERLVASMAS